MKALLVRFAARACVVEHARVYAHTKIFATLNQCNLLCKSYLQRCAIAQQKRAVSATSKRATARQNATLLRANARSNSTVLLRALRSVQRKIDGSVVRYNMQCYSKIGG